MSPPTTCAPTSKQMLIMEATPSILNVWEYGLAAAVITALFLCLWKGLSMSLEKFETISETNSKMVTGLTDKHREERDEWRNEAERREDKMVDLVQQIIKERDK